LLGVPAVWRGRLVGVGRPCCPEPTAQAVQVGQADRRHDLGCVLGQPAVADLGGAELPLDVAERVFGPRPDARVPPVALLPANRERRAEAAPGLVLVLDAPCRARAVRRLPLRRRGACRLHLDRRHPQGRLWQHSGLQRKLPTTDIAEERLIFSIGGNSFRLIAVAFRTVRVHYRKFVEHTWIVTGLPLRPSMSIDVKPIRPAAVDRACAWESEVALTAGALPGTTAFDRVDILIALPAACDVEYDPVEWSGDPIVNLVAYMELRDFGEAGLARMARSRRRVSDLPSRRRCMSLPIAGAIVAAWGIAAEALIRPKAPAASGDTKAAA
jgi:antitoxin component HigA of HigAB toxin-antitoxin module